VFVGKHGIRCGVVRKVRGENRKRFAFIPTPKACNYLPEKRPSDPKPKQRSVAAQHRARVAGGPNW
jgi:uracil-DNA glycosylase